MRRGVHIGASIALALGLGGAATAAADTSTGGVFLPLGHGARAHGLGGAGIALQRDDAATYWNPANLAWMQAHGGVTLMHAEVLPDVDNGYDTVSYGRPWGARLGQTSQPMRPAHWGWGGFYSHFGLGFDAGNWGENRLQLAGSWAFSNFASLGVGVKALWLGNDFESGNAHGAGFDLGLSVLVTEHWFASAVWRDAYTRVTFDTEMAQTVTAGFELGVDWEAHHDWSVEADLNLRESALQRLMAGVEWRPLRGAASVRAGWTLVSTGETRSYPSAGAGIRWSRLGLDYGVSFDAEDALGFGQRFALRVGL